MYYPRIRVNNFETYIHFSFVAMFNITKEVCFNIINFSVTFRNTMFKVIVNSFQLLHIIM